MAYDSDDRGAVNDSVTVRLGGREVLPLTYTIQAGVMDGPAGFSLGMGSGETIADIIRAAPPRTPFELSIGKVLQFTGETDGYEGESGEGGSTLSLIGRDDLAPLFDARVMVDTTFTETTIKDLVVKVLSLAGIHGYSLVFDNEANRKKVAGLGGGSAAAKQKAGPYSGPKFLGWSPSGPGSFTGLVGQKPIDPSAVRASAQAAAATGGAVAGNIALVMGLNFGLPEKSASATAKSKGAEGRKIQAKVGQGWLEFLREELDRAGLFLWAGPDKTFIISCPNRNQTPTYEILRRRGQRRNEVNVVRSHVRNLTTGRYAEALCYCHGGGKEKGRSTSLGRAVDAEMGALGYVRAFAVKDSKAKNLKQAEYLARKCLADKRRAGWALEYTVSGHTTPLAKGGQRVVWVPDTMVHVVDDDWGIDADLYIAAVEHRRGPATTTTLTLMRIEDLLTAEEPS